TPLPRASGKTWMTRTAITRPASVGTRMSRRGLAVISAPSRYILHHSIAYRKQTTARPEKIPIDTEMMRKNRSSRNTRRSRARGMRNRMGRVALSRATCVTELSSGSTANSVSLSGFGNKQQREIFTLRGGAVLGRLPLNAEHQVHSGIHGVLVEGAPRDLRLHL